MAKLSKWGDILGSLSNAMKGKITKRKKKDDFNPFDIFPDWFKSAFSKKAEQKDKETNQEKDGEDPYALNNYLFKRKPHKEFTPTTYNDDNIAKQITKFSSPNESQETAAPTNMGEYNELEGMWKGIAQVKEWECLDRVLLLSFRLQDIILKQNGLMFSTQTELFSLIRMCQWN